MGKKSGPKAPPAPDPKVTAAAQGAANVDTAIAQQFMNMIGSEGPYGTISYTPTGAQTSVGTGDNQRTIDQYKQITNFTPQGQRIFDLENAITEGSLGLGNRQIDAIGQNLQDRFSLDQFGDLPQSGTYGEEAQRYADQLYTGMTRRLDDRFGRDEESLRTRLANQGLDMGSEAYRNALQDFSQNRDDAYLSAMTEAERMRGAEQNRLFGLDLTGRQQGIQETLTERTQPINELAALLGNSGGVALPGFTAQAPQTGIANTDIIGPTMAAYNAKMNAYNQQSANSADTMGSLFGLAGTLGKAAMPFILSDDRAKEDINRVGTLANGLPVYLFRYKGDPQIHMGVMAQDVEKDNPEAVIEINGIKHVNYERAVQ